MRDRYTTVERGHKNITTAKGGMAQEGQEGQRRKKGVE